MKELLSWQLLAQSAQMGSVAAASEALQIDQATAGRLLAALEVKVGRPLFVRRSRPFKLTYAGEHACGEIAPIIRSYELALEHIKKDASELKGTIRLSTAPGFVKDILIPELMEFQQIYPEIDFDLRLSQSEKDVARNQVDIAFTSNKPSDPDILYFWRDHTLLIPVASRSYIEKHGFVNHPEELRNHFGFVYSGPVRPEASVMYRGDTAVRVRWKKMMKVPDIIAIKNAVLAGYGISIDMPIVHCHKEIAAGDLIPILGNWSVPSKECFAITSKAAYSTLRVKTFLDWYIPRSVQRARERDRRIADRTGLCL
jgi:DNA-binding transcriptional LysR family regulator